MKEIWKDIVGYEGLYQVSNMGRIRSLDRYKKLANGKQFILKGRIRKHYLTKHGYCNMLLTKDNKSKHISLHRAVATAFINNIDNKPQVNHKNAIRTDNREENLERMTQKENNNYSLYVIGRPGTRKGHTGKLNKLSKRVGQYTLDGNLIKMWDSVRDICRALGFSNGQISDCCLSKKKIAKGFNRKYL